MSDEYGIWPIVHDLLDKIDQGFVTRISGYTGVNDLDPVLRNLFL
jgi:hypothetical protein